MTNYKVVNDLHSLVDAAQAIFVEKDNIIHAKVTMIDDLQHQLAECQQHEPKTVGLEYGYLRDGMSLRDWFAGQAMANVVTWKDCGEPDEVISLAIAAYDIADAMIAEKRRREARDD